MNETVLVALIVLAGGIATTVVNLILGNRKQQSVDRQNSGTISTTSAAKLWDESNALRKEYRDAKILSDKRAEKLEDRLEAVNTKLDEALDKIDQLQVINEEQRKEIESLRDIIEGTKQANQRELDSRRDELKAEEIANE